MKQLYTKESWTSESLMEIWKVIDKLAKDKYGFDYYTPQFEIVSQSQMLESYCSHALPIMYPHWSFGKQYIQYQQARKAKQMGLALETIINTDPCLCYLVDNNSTTTQVTIMCHAAVGHSMFFKQNYLFKEHTNAKSILSYLEFARDFVEKAEQKYGEKKIADLITMAHAIADNSVDRYVRVKRTDQEMHSQQMEYALFQERQNNELQRASIPKKSKQSELLFNGTVDEDNLLYFIEKNSLCLQPTEREILRIVRMVNQYLYPQRLTKVMNEGWATFVQHLLMNDLHDMGYITPGQYLDFANLHSNVIYQHDHFGQSINPYNLGFNIFKSIKKANPDNWLEVVKDVVCNYKDADFIRQFLTDEIIEDLHLCHLYMSLKEQSGVVENISDGEFNEDLKREFAKMYEYDYNVPDISIIEFINHTSPRLVLKFDYEQVDAENMEDVLDYIEDLMGCKVEYTNKSKIAEGY